MLKFVPYHLIPEIIPEKVSKEDIQHNLMMVKLISAHCTTQEVCKEVIDRFPFMLELVPNGNKIQELYEKVIDVYSFASETVPDWFVTTKMLQVFYKNLDFNYCYKLLLGITNINNTKHIKGKYIKSSCL